MPAAAPFLATQLPYVYRTAGWEETPAGGASNMTSPFRKMRGYRAIPVVLALAWLPYIGTRCIENPLTHTCVMMAAMAHHRASGAHTAAASGQHAHCHGNKHTPARGCCCDLAGKCDIRGSSSVPSLTSAQLVGTLPVAVSATVVQTQIFDARGGIVVAHGPPTYLRNVTLRI